MVMIKRHEDSDDSARGYRRAHHKPTTATGFNVTLVDWLLGCVFLSVMIMTWTSACLGDFLGTMESDEAAVTTAPTVMTMDNYADRSTESLPLAPENNFLAALKEEEDDEAGGDDGAEKEHITGDDSTRPMIDLLSIGTLSRLHYQDMQAATMGRHRAVRTFFRVHELNDTEVNCHVDLAPETMEQFAQHCAQETEYPYLNVLKQTFAKGGNVKWLMKKTNPAGWLCAQKRPIDGLHAVLRQYKDQLSFSASTSGSATAVNEVLPDYLVIMDDDSWINLDTILTLGQRLYPSDTAYALAGCLMRRDITVQNFTSPFGGFSTILTRAALQNFLRPLPDCSSSSATTGGLSSLLLDEFDQNACGRLLQNNLGERQFFLPGMSVGDLMYAYAANQLFVHRQQWGSPGFCLHSDVALAYFINFYNIPIHSNDPAFIHVPEDRYRGFNGSSVYFGDKSLAKGLIQTDRTECRHDSDSDCPVEAIFCHRVTPDRVQKVFQKLQKRHPRSYDSSSMSEERAKGSSSVYSIPSTTD